MGGFGSGKNPGSTPQMSAPRGPELEEVIKCGKDPVYFSNKYCKIQHPQRGTIPFKTYPFQDDCFHAFLKHKFNIVLKSRQLGLSTMTAAYAVWLALFRKDKSILVIATKLSTAKNFIKKVRKILACLPPWMRLCSYEESQQEVRFDNGSQIKAIPTSDDAGRSEALSLLIVDEAAFIRNFDEIWTAIFPTLSEGGAAIILSTPNGVGGQYHDLWVGAETKTNGFNSIRLPWDVHPEHNAAWFEKQCLKLGSKRRAAQELLCEFLSSGEVFLQSYTMEWLSKELRVPISREGPEHGVWVWSEPISNHKYLIGADVARGDSGDYSTFVIIDMTTGEIVVEYQGKVFPDALAEVLDFYGRKYNNALVCVEANTFGNHTLSDLKKLRYPNIYYSTAPKHSVENYYASDKDKAGFSTQSDSRAEALARLEDSLRGHSVIPKSNRLYEELQTFVWIDNKPQAKKGKYDDIVMATAIACWVYRGIFENYRLSMIGKVTGRLAAEKPLFMYSSSKQYSLNPHTAITSDKVKPQVQRYFGMDPNDLKWLLS